MYIYTYIICIYYCVYMWSSHALGSACVCANMRVCSHSGICHNCKCVCECMFVRFLGRGEIPPPGLEPGSFG